MNYIIFDLEATCDNNKVFDNEIIEIGAVKINTVPNSNYIEETTFNTFVKPNDNPILTQFCKELTNISQTDVDNAILFPEAIIRFQEWIGTEYMLCSWGFYDRFQLIKDLQRHGMSDDWVTRHISLKHQFANIHKIKPCGMKQALQYLSIPLMGTHHRGIDDAKNISKIFLKEFNNWKFKS